jgi:hypothetical protein
MTSRASELERRRLALGQHPVLGQLARRLKAQLEPLLARALFIPEEKALLSRDGGACAADGARLSFRPLEPWQHRCPRCGTTYEGARHHRWWVTRYQIWLSERAIHCALLASLTGDATLRRHAAGILTAYAARYPEYPNQDNVLGPTRLFFSTYLESIWLVQIVIAAGLLEADPAAGEEARTVRQALEPVVAESAELIASFDEAFSNRQVWNNAALAAAGLWLNDKDHVTLALDGPHGLRAQLDGASDDGMWWEGENYHFFALHGFLLAAEVLAPAGIDLYAGSERLGLMYEAPLRTLLPDRTLPARGDAPYGVSILQPRFADLWEIGRARTHRAALDGILGELYAAPAPDAPDPGFDEIAEQEQNRPAQRLSRELLGWKSLLWMDPSPTPAAAETHEAAINVWDDLGLAVLKPNPSRYASVECGPTLSGHGHPDVLHLSVHQGAPWLADFGTGSYVAPSLKWYRSTLAHNAPGIAGEGQRAGLAWCEALDRAGDWSWCRAFAHGVLGPGSVAVRSVIAGPDYVADIVEVNVPPDITIDLPLHPLGAMALDPSSMARADWPVAADVGHEHGYDMAQHVRLLAELGAPIVVRGPPPDTAWQLVLAARPDETVWVATAPGPPDLAFSDTTPLDFLVRHATGPGTWAQVYAFVSAGVSAARFEGDTLAIDRAGGTDTVQLSPRGARIKTPGGEVQLAGLRPTPRFSGEGDQGGPSGPLIPMVRLDEVPAPGDWSGFPEGAQVQLGEPQYRRSELPYGVVPFTARVAAFTAADTVGFAIQVTKPDLVVRGSDAPELNLDNELSDIHSDGVQCYVGVDGWWGFVALPDIAGGVRVRAVAGTGGAGERVSGSWRKTPDGYAMVLAVRLDQALEEGDQVPVNVVINEMQPGRERRAGQLALSGGGWVYLRGDRESPLEASVAVVE